MSDSYAPGTCNIGSAEIARRRRSGHLGAAVTLAALVVIAVTDLGMVRLFVALPAAGAAAGYLQARGRFCLGFAIRGVQNFGELGETERVTAAEFVAADRRRAAGIGLRSLAVGAVVALLSLPL